MILGIDIGTTVTKSAVIHRDGSSTAHASRPTHLDRLSGGRVEQDFEEVLGSVAAVVRETVSQIAEIGDIGEIEAIAITGQGDGLWLRDKHGRAVRPPISWMDARASSIISQWGAEREGGSTVDRLFRATGSGAFPGSHAGILAWMDEHEPDSLARAAVAGYCVDAVTQRLTGRITVDASDASLPFLDVRKREYSDEALELVGVPQWRHLLAPPAHPGLLLPLDDAGAELLGLPAGIPVSSGPYDLQACGFGTGASTAGDGTLVVGTTLSCQALTAENTVDPESEAAGMWLCTPDPDLFLRVMPSMVGTASIDWLLRMLGAEPSQLNELLDASPPGANGVRALSFFAPSGERAPFVDPLARGQFVGLSLESTPADLVRSLCEAIAFAARHCFETIGLDGELSACGGGVRSVALTQLLADTLGRPIAVPLEQEVGIRGAALVAWASLGNPVDRDAWRAQRRVFQPDASASRQLDEHYAAYLADLAEARSTWHRA